jgi:uncharacterized Tic20 family protein
MWKKLPYTNSLERAIIASVLGIAFTVWIFYQFILILVHGSITATEPNRAILISEIAAIVISFALLLEVLIRHIARLRNRSKE